MDLQALSDHSTSMPTARSRVARAATTLLYSPTRRCSTSTTRIDQLGRQTTYTYDNLGRLLTITPPLPTTTTPPASVTTTNQYDPLGRLTQVTEPMGKVTTYTY